jgi:hypothetical protein
MRFEELYNSVYLKEDEANKETEEAPAESGGSTVPMPEDFDDVEPIPQAPGEQAEGETEGTTSEATAPTGATLKDYIFQLEDFAEKINGLEGTSLQSLVSSLDRPGTPFDGISSRTKVDIVSVAETLLSISEKLKSFMINAVKR